MSSKISELPAAGFLSGSELLPIVQTGNTKRVTVNDLGLFLKDTVDTIAGPQGIQGEPGLTGPQGDIGPQGVQGEPGPIAVAQTLAVVPLGTTAWNAALGVNVYLTLTSNTSLATPTNLPSSGLITLIVDQDTVGGKTVTLSSGYKFSGGVTPVGSTNANLRDIYQFITDGTNLYNTAFVSGIPL